MLLKSGGKRFLLALSNCIFDGTPSLSRSCLITVAWMSSSLSPLRGCNDFQPLACSILASKLLDSLSYDRVLEERVLASLSLLNVVRHPGTFAKLVMAMWPKNCISNLSASWVILSSPFLIWQNAWRRFSHWIKKPSSHSKILRRWRGPQRSSSLPAADNNARSDPQRSRTTHQHVIGSNCFARSVIATVVHKLFCWYVKPYSSVPLVLDFGFRC